MDRINYQLTKRTFNLELASLQVIDFSARQNYQAIESRGYDMGKIDYHASELLTGSFALRLALLPLPNAQQVPLLA